MTDAQRPIVNPKNLKLDHWRRGSFFESSDVSFGALLGLKDIGIGYGEVPPGKSGCPFHNHHVEEELFIILEGEGTYRFGSERHAVGQATYSERPLAARRPRITSSIPARCRSNTCHFHHRGHRNLRISGLRQVPGKARRPGEGQASFDFIGRAPSAADYWDGEPGF